MRTGLLLSWVVASVLLAACKVGPNFTEPHETVPKQFAGAGETGAGAPAILADAEPNSFWWQQFHDTELDALESRAVSGNLNLQAAYLRIVEARMQVMAARAQGLPSLNASASYSREQLGLKGIVKSQHVDTSGSSAEQGLISTLEKPSNLYQLGFDASWELDLFGKVRRSVEAADANRSGAENARNDLRVSLQAEVAQDYLQLRAAQLLRKVTRQQIAAQQDVFDLTQNRQQHGLAGAAESESASAQLAALQGELPPYEATIRASRHALAVLLGALPESLDQELADDADFPSLPESVPVGLPSQLARRRPDIRQSEDALHAATAQVGVAVASLFPDISLTGTLGLRNLSPGYLLDWDSHFYTFGPSVSIPIFHGGALVANVRLSKAEAAEAALAYRNTVLRALQEVEDGLDSLHQDAARVSALAQAVAADQRALQLNMDSYRHGLITYISALTIQIQLIQAQQQWTQALLTQSTDLVKLYKALGGGWQGT
jgi:outer membrane protein, multidrug efflux system